MIETDRVLRPLREAEPAIEQLEQALEAFDGTLLLVTHDRRMLETVRLTRRWEVDAGAVTEVLPGAPVQDQHNS